MAGIVDVDPKIRSAIESLKELLIIISGLAATNSILQLLESTLQNGQYSLTRLQFVPLLLCVINILTIARFSHGNYRQLDEEYSGGEGKGGSHAILTGSARVAADFTVVLIEALILSLASFLFVSPAQYIALIATLLVLDALWFFFAHTNTSNAPNTSSDELSASKSKAWALNNIVFGIIFVVLSRFPSGDSRATTILVVIFSALAFTNFSIDIFTEVRFYFPRPTVAKWDVFLGAPFTGKYNIKTGEWLDSDSNLKILIDALIEDLQGAGYRVHSAHKIEEFGKNLRSPADALVEDLAAVRASQVMVAIMTSPPSPGLQIELGAAITLQKPIIQVIGQGVELPYLNQGLSKYPNAREVRYRTVDDCVKLVRNELVRQQLQFVSPVRSSGR